MDVARPNGDRAFDRRVGELILAVYVDMVEYGDLEGTFDPIRHEGIALQPDPWTAICGIIGSASIAAMT